MVTLALAGGNMVHIIENHFIPQQHHYYNPFWPLTTKPMWVHVLL